MHFRLDSEALTSLYVTGRSATLPVAAISSFFEALEAVEACADIGEVVRVRSLRADISTQRVRLPLDGEFLLHGVCEPASDGDSEIVFKGIEAMA